MQKTTHLREVHSVKQMAPPNRTPCAHGRSGRTVELAPCVTGAAGLFVRRTVSTMRTGGQAASGAHEAVLLGKVLRVFPYSCNVIQELVVPGHARITRVGTAPSALLLLEPENRAV